LHAIVSTFHSLKLSLPFLSSDKPHLGASLYGHLALNLIQNGLNLLRRHHSVSRMSDNANVASLRALLKTGGLADLGPGPRPEALPLKELDRLLPPRIGGGPTDELARALVLLWHDHHDAAHEIAQSIETADGSFIHGIVHRREPDYGNAKYWFRRIGTHPVLPKIAEAAKTFLTWKNPDGLITPLGAGERWDTFVFIDLCKNVANKPASDPQTMLLRELQAIEFSVLLDHILAE